MSNKKLKKELSLFEIIDDLKKTVKNENKFDKDKIYKKSNNNLKKTVKNENKSDKDKIYKKSNNNSINNDDIKRLFKTKEGINEIAKTLVELRKAGMVAFVDGTLKRIDE
jgi:parvulin-like peptidyl-prolyl isomerase